MRTLQALRCTSVACMCHVVRFLEKFEHVAVGCAGMQQLPGPPVPGMGAHGLPPQGSMSSRVMPSPQLPQQHPAGLPGASHLAMLPNMGMSLPQNGLQPHLGGPMYANIGSMNGPLPYMMPGAMQNRHLGAAGAQQPVPAGQSQTLPGPQVRQLCSSSHAVAVRLALHEGLNQLPSFRHSDTQEKWDSL